MNKKVKELNQLNNELDKQINEENQEMFTNMVCYLRGANISEYDQELVRHDLTEMILSAQKRGDSLHSVIGNDFQLFCDNVIASLPPKPAKQRVLELVDIACRCLSILGFIAILSSNETINLIRSLISGNTPHFNISVSLGMVVSIGIILATSVIIVELIMKNAFKTAKGSKKARHGFAAGAGIVSVFLLITWLGRKVLFTINIFIALAVVLFLYLSHKFLERV